MTTVSQLRRAALALPEAEAETRAGVLRFSVGGKEFAALTEDRRVRLHLPAAEVEAELAARPAGERIVRRGAPVGVLVPLADVDGKDLNALVWAAWRFRAPRRLSAALDAVVAGERPAESDLPAAIGRPATRALLGAGLTTLALVATRTEQELLALHGVGQKAVRVLADALAERGGSLHRPGG